MSFNNIFLLKLGVRSATTESSDNNEHYYTFNNPKPGNAHLNSEGERITYRFDLLSLRDLLVRNQLHLCLQNFFSTSKQPSPNQ